MRTKLVLAENFQHADMVAYHLGWPRRTWIYVHRAEQLLGRDPASYEVVVYETFHRLPTEQRIPMNEVLLRLDALGMPFTYPTEAKLRAVFFGDADETGVPEPGV